jgi:integrase
MEPTTATPTSIRIEGFGTLKRRGSIWWIRYSTGAGRREESSGSEDQKKALALLKLRTQESKDPRRDATAEAKVRMAELFDLVKQDYQNNGQRSGETLAHRRKHLDPFFGELKAVRVTGATIERYKRQRLDAKAAPATVNRELAVVRRAFRLGVKQGLLTSRPEFDALAENNVRQGFTDEATFADIEQHLRAADADDVADVARFAYESASRRGSVLGLEWKDVDRTRGLVRFPDEIEKNGEVREVPLVGPLADMIEKRWKLRRLGCPYVFHRNGHRIKDLRGAWAQACNAAGVPDLLFHDLRRSGVRNMELHHMARSLAMRVSGHKTEAVYRRYAIVTTDDVRAELERVQAAKASAKVLPMR